MTDIEEEKIIKYIMLTQMKGFGPVTQNTLLDVCGGIESCFTEDSNYLFEHEDIAKRIGKRRIEKLLIQKADRKLREQAEQIYINAGDYDIKIITRESNLFPERFRGISDMPIEYFQNPVKKYDVERCKALGINIPDGYEPIE